MRRRRSGGASIPPQEPPRAGGILLASEGRPIPQAAIDEAARLARERGVPVHVFSTARIWGTGLGIPVPGLLPTKREWDEQREHVTNAVERLRRSGIEADGHVVSTRKSSKRIVKEAIVRRCDEIVMGADRSRAWLLADFMWSQEPQRVRRRAKIPVHLVEEESEGK